MVRRFFTEMAGDADMLWRAARDMVVLFVSEGSTLPTGYGVAWYSPNKQGVYAAPIPLNWLLGKAVYAYWTLVQGPKMPVWLLSQMMVKRGFTESEPAPVEPPHAVQAMDGSGYA